MNSGGFTPWILFGVLRRFQHYRSYHNGSWTGTGNQYIQLVKVLYCKLPTNGKELPAFPLELGPGTKPQPQSLEARVLPLCHRGPFLLYGGLAPLRGRFRSIYFSVGVFDLQLNRRFM